MCIISFNPKGVPYNLDEMGVAFDNNPDGFGLLWMDGRVLRMEKGLVERADFLARLRELDGVPHALHLRWRTRGKVTVENCHPFLITEAHSYQVWMMHNGTFGSVRADGDRSDTQVFASQLGEKVSGMNPRVLFNTAVTSKIESRIESYNKVLFIGSDGEFAVLNRRAWVERNGILFSNEYSFDDQHRVTQATKNPFGAVAIEAYKMRVDFYRKARGEMPEDDNVGARLERWQQKVGASQKQVPLPRVKRGSEAHAAMTSLSSVEGRERAIQPVRRKVSELDKGRTIKPIGDADVLQRVVDGDRLVFDLGNLGKVRGVFLRGGKYVSAQFSNELVQRAKVDYRKTAKKLLRNASRQL